MSLNSFINKRNIILGVLFLISLILLNRYFDIIKYKSSENGNQNFGKLNILTNSDDNDPRPRHVLFDLGANRGDSIYNFLGITNTLPGGSLNNPLFPNTFKKAKWIIYGFEANSFFDNELDIMKQKVEQLGHSMA
jgi:hypothetical protein